MAVRYDSPRMIRFSAAIAAAFAITVLAGACDSGDKKSDRADVKATKDKTGDAKAAKVVEAPAGKVFFVTPKDNATVPTRLDVEMGVEGKTVEPAGATERDPLMGHHHIIIDGSALPDMQVVPKDEKHLHYGDGSTKTTLLLTPGKHTLTMQFADGAHRSYGPDWSSTITVTVAEAPTDGKEGPADGKEAPADG